MKVYSISLRRLGIKAVSLLLVLALLAATLPVVALAQTTCSRNYTVQSGDTLSKISVTYDISVAELAAANNLKEPYSLYVGQVLCIPGSTTTTTSTSTTATTKSDQKINVTFGISTLSFKFTGLGKNGNFVVKIRKYDRANDDWFKVGRFKANKKGEASVTMKFPRALRDATYIQVCVKNLTNDKVECQKFRR